MFALTLPNLAKPIQPDCRYGSELANFAGEDYKFSEGGGGEIFGSSHDTRGEIRSLLSAWTIRLGRRSPRGPSVWLAALRLDYLEQYILVALIHSNLQRDIVHGAASQLMSGLLRQMLQQATCTKSPGTQASADAAADEGASEAGTSQSAVATQLGQKPMD